MLISYVVINDITRLLSSSFRRCSSNRECLQVFPTTVEEQRCDYHNVSVNSTVVCQYDDDDDDSDYPTNVLNEIRVRYPLFGMPHNQDCDSVGEGIVD